MASEALFASMGACVKQLSVSLPNEMAVFMRNIFGLILLSYWLADKLANYRIF